jgi:signal transduction histidine kinase/ActR/RegA family two-component response regulator
VNRPPPSPEEEIRRLEIELERTRREVRQFRRVAATSDAVANQSKRAMLRSNEKLKGTVAQLEATTERLQIAKQKAEAANEAKTRFLATMSHEIRTPMNGVIGCLELLLTSELDGEQRQIVDLMSNSAGALRGLINDVLDCAKVEAGRIELEQIPFSLMDCLEGIVGQELPAARKAGIHLSLKVARGVSDRVVGDPTRLRQVLSNLVSNAVKFTRRGGIWISVRAEEDDRIRFSVEDSGIGIPEHALAAIFEPFTQADTGTTRSYGGSGLGLAICKGLVELMEDDLEVVSEVGHGSCFRFSYRLPSEALQQPIEPAAPHAGPAPRDRERVLLVDDNPTNRLITSKMLEQLGCHVETASNGLESVELHAAGDFDIVFMDCSMPIMDGYEATAILRRAQGPKSLVPIVALTAFAMSGDRERCLECGMDGYLSKPVRLTDLESVLVRFCRERHPAA